jgi:hypothetical protein
MQNFLLWADQLEKYTVIFCKLSGMVKTAFERQNMLIFGFKLSYCTKVS